MSTSYQEHVVALMEAYARAADTDNFGTVDEYGTRWARVPLMGRGNVFDLARQKAALDMPLRE